MSYTLIDVMADNLRSLLDFAKQELDERKHSGNDEDFAELENKVMSAEVALDGYELDVAMRREQSEAITLAGTHRALPHIQHLDGNPYNNDLSNLHVVFDDADMPEPIRDTGECSDFTDLPDPRDGAPGSGGLAAAVIALAIAAALVLLWWTQDPACRVPGVETPAHCVD